MKSIANRYKRGELVGVGFECDFAGVRCHVIAWENAQVERLRDDPVFTEGLIIDQCNVDVGCGLPLIVNIPEPKSVHEHKQAIDAISKQLTDGQTAIVIPGGVSFEEVEALKSKVAQLEAELAESKALVKLQLFKETPKIDPVAIAAVVDELPSEQREALQNGSWHVNPEAMVVDNHLPIVTEPAALVGALDGFPEVIATHETIEPAVTETPVEPIQEPVVAVSELTASPPAQAPDTPAESEAVEETAEAIEEVIEEPWKPVPGDSESKTIQNYFKQFGIATPHKDVIAALKEFGIEVTSSQVLLAKKAIKQ
jgi:hypothetical protein